VLVEVPVCPQRQPELVYPRLVRVLVRACLPLQQVLEYLWLEPEPLCQRMALERAC
jgi:hypothetical protein